MFPTNPNLGMNDPRLLSLLMAQHMTPGNTPGPVPQQTLTPGFRAPGLPGVPGMPDPQQQQGDGGLGAGMGMLGSALRGYKGSGSPSTSGREMGNAENDGLAGAIAGIQGIQQNADGTFSPPPMPTDIGTGGGGSGLASFWKWLNAGKGLW